MSDIGRVNRKPGSSLFPLKRKGTDPLQPESSEADFSEDLKKFDEESTGIVHGAEKADQTTVRHDIRRKRLMKKGEEKKPETEEKKEENQEEEEIRSAGSKIDLEV